MTVFEIAVQLANFVIRDARFAKPGLRSSAKALFREIEGEDPTDEQTDEIVRLFWEELDRRNPNLREQRVPPVGRGSPNYVLEELSPWQENATRALEEGTHE